MSTIMLNFKYTILYVYDVEKTIEFYKQAFGLDKTMLHESGDYGELSTGNTKLSFTSLKLMEELGKTPIKPQKGAPSFEIAFETNDVDRALSNALNAGAELVQTTQKMPWGQTTAYVHDNNGFLIELCTPVIA